VAFTHEYPCGRGGRSLTDLNGLDCRRRTIEPQRGDAVFDRLSLAVPARHGHRLDLPAAICRCGNKVADCRRTHGTTRGHSGSRGGVGPGAGKSLASHTRFRRPYVLHLGAHARLRAIVLLLGVSAAQERPNGPRAVAGILDLFAGVVAAAHRRFVSVLDDITYKRGSMQCANTWNESVLLGDGRSRR